MLFPIDIQNTLQVVFVFYKLKNHYINLTDVFFIYEKLEEKKLYLNSYSITVSTSIRTARVYVDTFDIHSHGKYQSNVINKLHKS